MAQCLHGLTQVAFHDGVELVERQVDAMVRPTSLRKVVGADAVTAVATADQAFAQGRVFGGTLGALFFLNARCQHP